MDRYFDSILRDELLYVSTFRFCQTPILPFNQTKSKIYQGILKLVNRKQTDDAMAKNNNNKKKKTTTVHKTHHSRLKPCSNVGPIVENIYSSKSNLTHKTKTIRTFHVFLILWISINCVGMHSDIGTSNDNGIHTNIKYNLIMPRDLISQKELWTHDICELLFSWSVSYDESSRMGDKRITI